MKIVLLAILCLLLVGVQTAIKPTLKPGTVNILGDNGMYLARCNGCGPGSFADSAGVHDPNSNDPWAIWTIQRYGSKVAFRADSGYLLTRCYKCWGKTPYDDNSAFVHVATVQNNPWSLWTPQYLPNGKWAFKGDNGKYLSRCYGCVSDASFTDFAFVHVTTPTGNPWAQWTVQYKVPYKI